MVPSSSERRARFSSVDIKRTRESGSTYTSPTLSRLIAALAPLPVTNNWPVFHALLVEPAESDLDPTCGAPARLEIFHPESVGLAGGVVRDKNPVALTARKKIAIAVRRGAQGVLQKMGGRGTCGRGRTCGKT